MIYGRAGTKGGTVSLGCRFGKEVLQERKLDLIAAALFFCPGIESMQDEGVLKSLKGR